MSGPLCFVLMPFRPGRDDDGQRVDFDAVYKTLIVPAIEAAGMVPVRADEEPGGGIFHKRMFERLVLCDFAVADLSTSNPNVYYELGVRHGLRPHSTVLMFRRGWRLPLDIASSSALPYPVDPDGCPTEVEKTRTALTERLVTAREAATDSPVHQLVTGLPVVEVDHERIDAFREHAHRDQDLRRRLDDAVERGVAAIDELRAGLGKLIDMDLSTALSLVISYRSVSGWAQMVAIIEGLSRAVREVDMLQEQYAFALNRAGRDREAERVLQALLSTRASSETLGLLGRIYKDRWVCETSVRRRQGLLEKAIDVYLEGFETDWRDPYPGLNALMLMYLGDPSDDRFGSLAPVVRFAADRRLRAAGRQPDYWDHATDLGLHVLAGNEDEAGQALSRALAVVRDQFEPETTAADLSRISSAMRERGLDAAWLDEIVDELRSVRFPGAPELHMGGESPA